MALRSPPPDFAVDTDDATYLTTNTKLETTCFSTRVSFGENKTTSACDGVPRLRFLGNITSTGTSTVCVTQTHYALGYAKGPMGPMQKPMDATSTVNRPSQGVEGPVAKVGRRSEVATATSRSNLVVSGVPNDANIDNPRRAITEDPCSNSPENCAIRSAFFSSSLILKERKPSCSVQPSFCENIWAAVNRNDEVGSYTGILRHAANGRYPSMMMSRICPPRTRVCQATMKKEILILYWPDNARLDNSSNCGGGLGSSGSRTLFTANKRQVTETKPLVVTTDRITFRGVDLVKIEDGAKTKASFVPPSVLTGYFEFTSPTVYIAHHPVSASIAPIILFNKTQGTFTYEASSTGAATSTLVRPGGSIAVFPGDISSIRVLRGEPYGIGKAVDAKEYIRQIAAGTFDAMSLDRAFVQTYDIPTHTTVSLDLADLVDPVPASVYYDARYEDCWGMQSHCQTITDDSYRPILAFNERVWRELLTDVIPCSIQLVVDPAIAFSPVVENGEAIRSLKPLPKHQGFTTTTALANSDPRAGQDSPAGRVFDNSGEEAEPGGRLQAPGPVATAVATGFGGFGVNGGSDSPRGSGSGGLSGVNGGSGRPLIGSGNSGLPQNGAPRDQSRPEAQGDVRDGSGGVAGSSRPADGSGGNGGRGGSSENGGSGGSGGNGVGGGGSGGRDGSSSSGRTGSGGRDGGGSSGRGGNGGTGDNGGSDGSDGSTRGDDSNSSRDTKNPKHKGEANLLDLSFKSWYFIIVSALIATGAWGLVLDMS
jgi:hypothetical protein